MFPFSRMPFDKRQIEAAIVNLEKQSSAELRVYIERKIPLTSSISDLERALQVFTLLEMEKTVARNGVLIYIAFKDHKCSVIGDQGIHQYVGDEFWRQICDTMISHFKQKKYNEGIVNAIESIGKELALYFPHQPNDCDELSNEVVINE